MNKIIKVTDENGHTYSSTYVKRAKGLVKNNRAYWVDDKSICLKMPHKKMEVKKMNINDIDRMIALIQANNWAIKNSNNPNVYASASILAETYNEIVQELEDAEVHLPKSLSQIEYSIYENSANVQELIQMIYNKDCLIHPILKLEREKILSQNCNSNETKKENLKDVNLSVKENTNKIELYLNSIRTTLIDSMDKLQTENNKKIDEMRRTVDEKLDTTLNNRLNQSFKLVQDNLSKVEQGLGEMKDLANGVGDLKKVLSNVKTRGIWGEMQLSQILSQILTKDQYVENIITRPKSKDPVEFVIKLPGDGKQIVYLPIDSKFPLDTYTNLINAYETNDKAVIDKAITDLKQRMKSFAKDIRDKYLEIPYTTDFGIMFLPIEGLYAEAAKLGLIEELQNTYRIIIAGPTTMAALLNSLQVGFRTLAIEQRTSEVWNILAAVKTEFGTFETVLKKAQKKIGEANDEIEHLVGTRTRQIYSRTKSSNTASPKKDS